MTDPAIEVSKKLNVVIAFLLHFATKDEQFNEGKRKIRDLATYLKRHGLPYDEIAGDSRFAGFKCAGVSTSQKARGEKEKVREYATQEAESERPS